MTGAPAPLPIVRLGSRVTVEGDEGTEVFQLVAPAAASPRNGLVSVQSPLGRGLLYLREGDVATVVAPGGSFDLRIVRIE